MRYLNIMEFYARQKQEFYSQVLENFKQISSCVRPLNEHFALIANAATISAIFGQQTNILSEPFSSGKQMLPSPHQLHQRDTDLTADSLYLCVILCKKIYISQGSGGIPHILGRKKQRKIVEDYSIICRNLKISKLVVIARTYVENKKTIANCFGRFIEIDVMMHLSNDIDVKPHLSGDIATIIAQCEIQPCEFNGIWKINSQDIEKLMAVGTRSLDDFCASKSPLSSAKNQYLANYIKFIKSGNAFDICIDTLSPLFKRPRVCIYLDFEFKSHLQNRFPVTTFDTRIHMAGVTFVCSSRVAHKSICGTEKQIFRKLLWQIVKNTHAHGFDFQIYTMGHAEATRLRAFAKYDFPKAYRNIHFRACSRIIDIHKEISGKIFIRGLTNYGLKAILNALHAIGESPLSYFGAANSRDAQRKFSSLKEYNKVDCIGLYELHKFIQRAQM